ncbi:hypothetical protein PGTUg99_023576 [Puccinia graminis f. sp. tritici]|uniref:Uncharacterized protein n=1 Tax=Puccinia graminis f. sp. tritici TaxID=56615 RepID=A0A5B0QU98_PUCGR|nr:hypothetical protein PGTUg99_023576 [Puccinia graminis f. sp. tritici]
MVNRGELVVAYPFMDQLCPKYACFDYIIYSHGSQTSRLGHPVPCNVLLFPPLHLRGWAPVVPFDSLLVRPCINLTPDRETNSELAKTFNFNRYLTETGLLFSSEKAGSVYFYFPSLFFLNHSLDSSLFIHFTKTSNPPASLGEFSKTYTSDPLSSLFNRYSTDIVPPAASPLKISASTRMASPQAASPALASSQAASPAATASPKVSTPTKSTAPAPVVPPISNPPVTSAPAPSSPQATTVPIPISPPNTDSSTQHASVSQAAKSVPTSVASPNPVQPAPSISTSRPKSIIGTPANAPVGDANVDTPSSPDTLSDAPSGSKSVVGPVIGSIFAVLLVIIAVVGGVWYLQRRREKARVRHEAKRMRSSNFGLYETTGDVVQEKQASIEATLEADLARLRSLDANIPIIVDDYDSKYPERSSISHQPQPVPSLQIARKPSYLAKNSYKVAPSNIAGSRYAADSSPSAPAYVESTESKDYGGGGAGGGGGVCHSTTRAFPSFDPPASSLAEKR